VIAQIIKSSQEFEQADPQAIKSMISWRKNNWLLPQDVLHSVDEKHYLAAAVYQKYQKALEEANALDFDDLLLLPYHLFKTYPHILSKRQNKFKYVLVDEAQDTNRIQFELLKQLTIKPDGTTGNITFIGDDFQSIYWWRGAMMENFLNVKDWRKDIKIFRLQLNYRSRPHIVEASNHLIKHNTKQYQKDIQATRQGSDTIKLLVHADEIEEAVNIVYLIKRLKEQKNLSYNDFAILYRTNAQSQPFEQALITEWIPYKVWWGFKFFERKEIKDIISYLRFLYNPSDNLALKRIINVPSRKIWPTTIQKLEEFAIQHNMDLFEVIQRASQLPINLGTAAKNALQSFTNTIKLLQNALNQYSPPELINYIVNLIRYQDWLIKQEGEVKAEEKMQNIGQLISMASKFDKPGKDELKQFLDEVSLLTDADQQENSDTVKLMTVHAAKGLEFPVVFVVGLEENIFPLAKAKFDENQMEEERRLMYVAMTRAKDLLFLSFAKSRTQWWQTRYNPPSRFVNELPPELLKTYQLQAPSRLDTTPGEGQRVRHKIFGTGEIQEVFGNVAIVLFDNPKYGLRKIDINFLEAI